MHHFHRKIRHSSVYLAFLLLFLALVCAIASRSSGSSSDTAVPQSSQEQDAAFREYTNALFAREAAGNILTLHYTLQNPKVCGISEYHTSLGTFDSSQILSAAAAAESVKSALAHFSSDALSVQNKLTLAILKDTLDQTISAAAFPLYEEPLRPTTGVQSELPILLAEYTFSNAQDVTDYLEILASIPDYLNSICAFEQEKSDAGLFMTDFTADTVIEQCRDFANSGQNNYLVYTFDQKIDALKEGSDTEKKIWKEQNRTQLSKKVLPAFQSVADNLTALKGTGKNSRGLCGYPEGKSWYAHLVRCATGSSDSVSELKKRIEKQRNADLSACLKLTADNPQLEKEASEAKAPEKEAETTLPFLQEAMKEDFPDPPACNVNIKYVDEAMEDYLAPAFYLTSPLDNWKENTIYVNRKNGYEGIRLFTTLAHEGYPGHLYQNIYFHAQNPDPIRALSSYPGYTEGWATYVELLSYRYADLSADAATLLARNQFAILSLYASVDIGIHWDGWSYSDTFRFLSEYGFSDESQVREIYELIVAEPAHYLKYYVGCLEFLTLRDKFMQKYEQSSKQTKNSGADLSARNLRKFHQTVLEIGPAPFSVIAQQLFASEISD